LRPLARSLVQVYNTLRAPWFFGTLSSSEAESALVKAHRKRSAPGLFLVRFSTSEIGCFAVTVLEHREIKHYRITRADGKYLFGNNRFSTLEELVTKCKSALHLRTPCPGAPYGYLFASLGKSRESTLADGYVEFHSPTS